MFHGASVHESDLASRSDAERVAEARREIEQRCGIPGSCVMMGASHTHAGGPFCWGPDEKFLKKIPKLG